MRGLESRSKPAKDSVSDGGRAVNVGKVGVNETNNHLVENGAFGKERLDKDDIRFKMKGYALIE